MDITEESVPFVNFCPFHNWGVGGWGVGVLCWNSAFKDPRQKSLAVSSLSL